MDKMDKGSMKTTLAGQYRSCIEYSADDIMDKMREGIPTPKKQKYGLIMVVRPDEPDKDMFCGVAFLGAFPSMAALNSHIKYLERKNFIFADMYPVPMGEFGCFPPPADDSLEEKTYRDDKLAKFINRDVTHVEEAEAMMDARIAKERKLEQERKEEAAERAADFKRRLEAGEIDMADEKFIGSDDHKTMSEMVLQKLKDEDGKDGKRSISVKMGTPVTELPKDAKIVGEYKL